MSDLLDGAAGSYERREDIDKNPEELVRYWLNAISVSEKTEETFRKTADQAVDLYTGKTRSAFNILHSNVETLVPAIYNSQPVPDVRPRYSDPNEVARLAGQTIERALSYTLDEYDFDAVMTTVVKDMEIAGRGISRVAYKPLTRTETDETGQPVEKVIWQEATCEQVSWRSFRRGPGAAYVDWPWVAYEKFWTRDELIELAGEEVGALVPLDAVEHGHEKDEERREKSAWKKARGWEIWDRDTRQVFFIAPGYLKGPLRVDPDPLGLLDFFPSPAPLQAISDPDTGAPITPYETYRAQADELNTVSTRIIKLIGVLKYRGVRAAEVVEIDGLNELEDGQFAPSQGALSVLSSGTSLDDAIWVVPIDKLIAVLRELQAQRDQIKQVIYEITGVADILRGATDPRETLGAQQIKAQWASLRLQAQQGAVQRHCRDILRLKAEIIASKFTPETLAMIAGGEVAPEVLQVLRSDVRRTYLIDVETDSTVRGDLVRAQQNMSNFLTGSAQFFQTFVPLLQSQMLPPQVGMAAIAIYASFARQFKLGKQAEDALAKLGIAAEQAPIGQPDPKAQAEQEDARQINRAGMIADVEQKQADTQKTRVETAATAVNAAAQQVETAVIASGERQEGFVQ